MNLTTTDQDVDRKRRGARETAATSKITSQSSGGFKDPFAMFKKEVKRAEAPETERTVTDSGAEQVQFVKKPKRVIRSAKADAERAPKFDQVGDHSLPPGSAERLSALAGRRYCLK